MLFNRLFRRTDAPAGRVADWYTVGQIVGGLGGSALMSWIVSTIDPIMQYGYGAVILTGIAVALIISLVVSIGFIAWRYFHPLPQDEHPAPLAATAEIEANRSTILKLEQQFDKMVKVVFGKLHDIDHDRELNQTSSNAITNRISSLEQALAPTPPGLLGAIFQREGLAPDSRLAEIETYAEKLKEDIEKTKSDNIELHQALRDHVKSQIQQIDLRLKLFSTSLRAKYALEIITHSDKIILTVGDRLMVMDGRYDDLTWEAEYNTWYDAIQEIDRIAGLWTDHFEPFLHITRRQYEDAGMPTPQNIVANSDANSIRYKTVQIVRPSYANRRTGIIQYFDSKSRDFF